MIKLGEEKRNYEYFELICLLTVLLDQAYFIEFMPLLKTDISSAFILIKEK